jgi:hypothetical protein
VGQDAASERHHCRSTNVGSHNFGTMTTKNWVKILLINLGAGLLVLSPFLPGPPNGLVNLFYNAGQILGLLGLVAIPIGLIWTIRELKRKRNDNENQIDIKAIILLTLPLTLFLTSIYISGLVRDFSRDFAINRTDDLIHSIEKFKQKKGKYPDLLTDLTPEFIADIPSPLIMGIDNYDYKKQGDTYNVSFQQNVVLSFNFEVVTFDPTDNHKAEGELADIYDTGKSHWKYYVYD